MACCREILTINYVNICQTNEDSIFALRSAQPYFNRRFALRPMAYALSKHNIKFGASLKVKRVCNFINTYFHLIFN